MATDTTHRIVQQPVIPPTRPCAKDAVEQENTNGPNVLRHTPTLRVQAGVKKRAKGGVEKVVVKKRAKATRAKATERRIILT